MFTKITNISRKIKQYLTEKLEIDILKILISLALVLTIIIIYLSWEYYDTEFYKNVLVELHGFLFEMILLVILVHFITEKRNTKISITRAIEYLENNSSLEENFIMVNKIAHLNRLNKIYKEYKYVLQDFFINNQNLKDLKFIKAKLYGLHIKKTILSNSLFENVEAHSSKFIDSKIKNCTFNQCSFRKLLIQNSELININFRKSNLTKSDFSNLDIKSPVFIDNNMADAHFIRTILNSANFKDSDLTNVNFTNSILKNINFSNAILKNTNFTGAMIENVFFNKKRFDSVDELIEEINNIYPRSI